MVAPNVHDQEEEEEMEPLDDATRRQLPLSVLEYIHSLETKIESYQVQTRHILPSLI